MGYYNGKWIANGHHRDDAIHRTEMSDGGPPIGCGRSLERIAKSEFGGTFAHPVIMEQNKGHDWVLVCRKCHLDRAHWNKRLAKEESTVKALFGLKESGVLNTEQYTTALLEVVERIGDW